MFLLKRLFSTNNKNLLSHNKLQTMWQDFIVSSAEKLSIVTACICENWAHFHIQFYISSEV